MRWISRALWALGLVSLLVPTAAAAWRWFPEPHSPTEHQWIALFKTITIPAAIIFVLVEGMLIYALIRFRRRKSGPQEGPHIHGNTKMEIAWTIAPTLVMAWLLVVSLSALDRVDNGPNPDFTVTVVGRQFQWEFQYPDGTSTRDKLYVEQGRVVGLDITSLDVIHAFNVPSLGVMRDAVPNGIPGKVNHDWFRADEAGTYLAQCRELCGVNHGKMHAQVVVFAPGTQEKPYGLPPANATTPTPPAGNGTAGNNTNQTASATQDVKLTGDFTIDPKEVTQSDWAGKTIKIHVENTAPATLVHNLYIGPKYDSSGASALWHTADLAGGASEDLLVEFPAQPGAWEWWCNIPGHYDAMHGVLSTGGSFAGGEPKPLLPGLEFPAIVAGLGVAVLVVARRRAA